MAARGLMANPALLLGTIRCSGESLRLQHEITFAISVRFASHVPEMILSMVPRRERVQMIDNCRSIVGLID